jgi:hypothetical protein
VRRTAAVDQDLVAVRRQHDQAIEQIVVDRQLIAPEIADEVTAHRILPRRRIRGRVDQHRVEPLGGDGHGEPKPLPRHQERERHDQRQLHGVVGRDDRIADEHDAERHRRIDQRDGDRALHDEAEPAGEQPAELAILDPPQPDERRKHHRHGHRDQRAPGEAAGREQHAAAVGGLGRRDRDPDPADAHRADQCAQPGATRDPHDAAAAQAAVHDRRGEHGDREAQRAQQLARRRQLRRARRLGSGGVIARRARQAVQLVAQRACKADAVEVAEHDRTAQRSRRTWPQRAQVVVEARGAERAAHHEIDARRAQRRVAARSAAARRRPRREPVIGQIGRQRLDQRVAPPRCARQGRDLDHDAAPWAGAPGGLGARRQCGDDQPGARDAAKPPVHGWPSRITPLPHSRSAGPRRVELLLPARVTRVHRLRLVDAGQLRESEQRADRAHLVHGGAVAGRIDAVANLLPQLAERRRKLVGARILQLAGLRPAGRRCGQ